ncbi:hypothetical protein PR048_025088 [Dryococelus australis]|uniref:Uncharacterized protein n=1 Tax=Dryococelus australis TaxID=614101 RepID=A0ABQ9GQF2_9NEOP|nr:hypothetical protein PR048_025088 [Dryococelus australis]
MNKRCGANNISQSRANCWSTGGQLLVKIKNWPTMPHKHRINTVVTADYSPPTLANQVRLPAGSLPDFRMWELCPGGAAGRRVFLGISRFPCPRILALLHKSGGLPSNLPSLRLCPWAPKHKGLNDSKLINKVMSKAGGISQCSRLFATEDGVAAECKGEGMGMPRKITRRPTRRPPRFPTCGNPGVLAGNQARFALMGGRVDVSLGQYQLGSLLVDDRSMIYATKYRVVSGVVWTNRTVVSSNTDANRTGVLAVVDIVQSGIVCVNKKTALRFLSFRHTVVVNDQAPLSALDKQHHITAMRRSSPIAIRIERTREVSLMKTNLSLILDCCHVSDGLGTARQDSHSHALRTRVHLRARERNFRQSALVAPWKHAPDRWSREEQNSASCAASSAELERADDEDVDDSAEVEGDVEVMYDCHDCRLDNGIAPRQRRARASGTSGVPDNATLSRAIAVKCTSYLRPADARIAAKCKDHSEKFHRARQGRGGLVVRLIVSHVGEPGSIHDGVAPGFSCVGILPNNAANRRVFSGISRFPALSFRRCSIPHFTLMGSQDLDAKSRSNLFTHLTGHVRHASHVQKSASDPVGN